MRGWPVVYSSGPLTTWERGSERWRQSRFLGEFTSESGVRIDNPGRIAAYWPGSPLWTGIALRRHASRLHRAAVGHAARADDRGPLVALLFHPRYWPHALALRPDRIVYFAYDALSLSPGWDEQQAAWERALVERADLIVGYSEQMFDHMPERARRIGKVMPTGVDLDHFDGAERMNCPPDLAAIPSPKVGYTGHINQKLDLALMLDVARRSPRLNFVFVGPAGPGNGGTFDGHPAETGFWKQLLGLPNVHHLGPKNFADVPAYMAHMDVNVMCYRLEGGWWQAGYPLKMHEYLAVGKPVVSTGLQTILPFGDVIDIVAGAEAWAAALERAVSGGGVGSPDARREVARKNSWDVRLDNLDRWMRQTV